MPTILTFRDFHWSSSHHIPGKYGAASMPHWHSYRCRLWFKGPIDQDELVKKIEDLFAPLHGAILNTLIQPDTSDETVAVWVLEQARNNLGDCVRVMLLNDGLRGADVTL